MPTKLPSKDTLHLFIRSREKLLFDGPVKSVSSLNTSGPFDILPEHTNFISIIKDFIAIGLPDGRMQKIKINDAILKVINNEVRIFLGVVANKPTPQAPKAPVAK